MSTSNRSLTVLIGGTLTMMLALGLRQSFGLYLIPITQTFGWSRETFSLAVALQMLLAGLGQPLAGVVARVMRSRLKPKPRAARLTILPEP